MSKNKKKPSISTYKLPNISILNTVSSARSLTEGLDPTVAYNHRPDILTPVSALAKKRQNVTNVNDFIQVPTKQSNFLKKQRQSVPDIQTTDNHTIQKIVSSPEKRFTSSYVSQHVEEERKVKLISIPKMKNEVFLSKMLNPEQVTKLKKITFFIQEMVSKVTNPNINNNQQLTNLNQFLTQIESDIFSLLVSLSNTFDSKLKEIKNLTNRIEEMQTSLKEYEINYRIQHEYEYEKLERTKKRVEMSLKEKEIFENSHFFTVQKLTSENEYLQDKLKDLLDFQDFKKLMKDFEAVRLQNKLKTEKYETELRDRDVMITRYEIMYSGTRRMNEDLDNLKKSLENKVRELEEKIRNQEIAYEKLAEERDMYRERALMQRSDHEELQLQHENLHEYLQKMKDRYLLERKRGELLVQQSNTERTEELNAFGYEVKTFEYIRHMLIVGPGRHLLSKKDKDKEDDKEKEKEKEKEIIKERYNYEVDLKHYMMVKPTYLALFQKQKLYLLIKDVKFTHEFMATLRGIYDSKYNEFLYADSYTQISRFPDFVYSWMGKFVIDLVTRKVRTADIKDPDPEVVKNEMIVLFQNPMASRLWECVTFKEFLDEQHTRDELIYFLHCRNMLFKGPQLNDTSSTFIFSYCVKLEWAEYVLEKILGQRHRRETLNLMRTKFRERSKLKKETLMLDSSFFLRVLLEEYKKDKAEKISKLKKIFSEDMEAGAHGKGKVIISFDHFKDFMGNHFPEVYDLEKAELYRKCWAFGNGNVDVDTILLVLNEENFFTRTMKFPSLDDKFIPKSLEPQSSLEKVYDSVYQQYEKIENDIDFVHEIVAKLGVEKFLGDLYEFEKRIKSQGLGDGKGFQGKDIHLTLASFSSHLYKLSQVMLSNDDVAKEINIFNDLREVFTTIRHTLKGLVLLQAAEVREFEMNVKAKRLQKFFKSKLSTWYKLMNFILKHRLKKYVGSRKTSMNYEF